MTARNGGNLPGELVKHVLGQLAGQLDVGMVHKPSLEDDEHQDGAAPETDKIHTLDLHFLQGGQGGHPDAVGGLSQQLGDVG